MSYRRNDIDHGISGQAADEAGYWDARLRSPDCTDDDRARFDEWRRASPTHEECFDRLQVILASLRQNMARADIRALRDAALREDQSNTSRKRIFATALAFVAVAVTTVLWIALPEHLRHAPLQELASIARTLAGSPRADVYETGTGQRSISTLRDGSSVELNDETRIQVVFTHKIRRVALIYGQAFFHVAHEAHRPFIVRVADREITAVGTQFDVRLDATAVRVTLIEGQVKVSQESSSATGETAQAPTLEMPASYLSPGQQFIARRLASADAAQPQPDALIHNVDVSKVTGWRNGRIFLEDLPLNEAIAEMNRHSPVQIRLADPQLDTFRVNGMFHAGEQKTFVAALEQYFPITARALSDTEIVLTLRR